MNHPHPPVWEDPEHRKARLRSQFWRDLFAKGCHWGTMTHKPIRATSDEEAVNRLIVETGGRTW